MAKDWTKVKMGIENLPKQEEKPLPVPTFPGYGVPITGIPATNTQPTNTPWKPSFTLPKINYGDYAVNLKNIGTGLQQAEATTGLTIGDQARAGLYQAGMNVGAQQASMDTQRRLERIEKGRQNEIQQQMVRLQERGLELQEKSIDKQGGSGCAFIFTYMYQGYPHIAKRYRDEHVTQKQKRGYYRVSDIVLPVIKRSFLAKMFIKLVMTAPMMSYGRYFYKQNRIGIIFKPIAKFWLSVFDLLGRKPYTRSNGEVL